MKNKSHLTLKGLNEIQIIKAGMNRGRDSSPVGGPCPIN